MPRRHNTSTADNTTGSIIENSTDVYNWRAILNTDGTTQLVREEETPGRIEEPITPGTNMGAFQLYFDSRMRVTEIPTMQRELRKKEDTDTIEYVVPDGEDPLPF